MKSKCQNLVSTIIRESIITDIKHCDIILGRDFLLTCKRDQLDYAFLNWLNTIHLVESVSPSSINRNDHFLGMQVASSEVGLLESFDISSIDHPTQDKVYPESEFQADAELGVSDDDTVNNTPHAVAANTSHDLLDNLSHSLTTGVILTGYSDKSDVYIMTSFNTDLPTSTQEHQSLTVEPEILQGKDSESLPELKTPSDLEDEMPNVSHIVQHVERQGSITKSGSQWMNTRWIRTQTALKSLARSQNQTYKTIID